MFFEVLFSFIFYARAIKPVLTIESFVFVFSKLNLNYSGTPLRPKAAKVEPHTHTKRYAGDFLWSWQAEWLAGACAVHTYIHTYVHRIS